MNKRIISKYMLIAILFASMLGCQSFERPNQLGVGFFTPTGSEMQDIYDFAFPALELSFRGPISGMFTNPGQYKPENPREAGLWIYGTDFGFHYKDGKLSGGDIDSLETVWTNLVYRFMFGYIYSPGEEAKMKGEGIYTLVGIAMHSYTERYDVVFIDDTTESGTNEDLLFGSCMKIGYRFGGDGPVSFFFELGYDGVEDESYDFGGLSLILGIIF